MSTSARNASLTRNRQAIPNYRKRKRASLENGETMKPLTVQRFFLVMILCYTSTAIAAEDPNGVLDTVIAAFRSRSSAWQSVVMSAASWLFWTLGTISLTWTGGMLALRKADIQEFFAEFVRFTLFFGFFYWLLKNGPALADSIVRSLRQIGDSAAGTSGLSPSNVVDVGFLIWGKAVDNLSIWSPVDSFIGIVLSLGVLILLALTAINMLLLLISGWILMYAGIFFLGFGGSRWTSDIAISYFKAILGVAVQLLGMILIVGVGLDLLTGFFNQMGKGALNFKELGVMLTFCLSLLVLSSKIPAMLAGVLSGHGVHGIGQMTAGGVLGAVLGAAAVTSAAVATAGAALAAGGANIAGGAQAVMAALSKANAAEGSGSSSGAGMAALSDFVGSGSSGVGTSPLAAAMGCAASESTNQGRAGGAGGAGGTSDAGSGRAAAQQSDFKSGSEAEGTGAAPGEVPRASALKSAAGMAAKAGRIAIGTAENLAMGTYDVGKSKLGEIKDRARVRIAQTPGGQVAAAINARAERDKAPMFGADSLSASLEPADRESEVGAFRDRAC
ncbi:MAG: P-type conjugative transfer protein TrbL [Terriglobales bacterium]